MSCDSHNFYREGCRACETSCNDPLGAVKETFQENMPLPRIAKALGLEATKACPDCYVRVGTNCATCLNRRSVPITWDDVEEQARELRRRTWEDVLEEEFRARFDEGLRHGKAIAEDAARRAQGGE